MTVIQELFKENDRLMVIAAHPDDEALGAAGLIQKVTAAGGAAHVIYLTHGDGNLLAGFFHLGKPVLTKRTRVLMGSQRRHEAISAMQGLGMNEGDLTFLGHPDLGLMSLWRKKKRVIVEDLAGILTAFRPTHVVAPAVFDGHADHRAAALIARAAIDQCSEKLTTPRLLSYLIHSSRWPNPKKFTPEEMLTPPKKWADKTEWLSVPMNVNELEKKREALLRYESQMSYSRDFLLSFARRNELFAV